MRPGMSVRVEVLGPEVQGRPAGAAAALDFAAGRPRALLATGGAAPVKLGACGARSASSSRASRRGPGCASRDEGSRRPRREERMSPRQRRIARFAAGGAVLLAVAVCLWLVAGAGRGLGAGGDWVRCGARTW